MKVLDLFSGIGGFSLAAKWAGYTTVAFCEIDPYCQKVLKKNFPEIPIFSDIKKLKRSDINGSIDIITGGFPCQPFSVAGRKKGTEDDRDLWPQMFRVIKEFKPTWVIGENVAHFVNMAFQRTKIDLESEGYEVQPFIIPACSLGAPHRRDRVWIVAYSEHNGLYSEKQRFFSKKNESSTARENDTEAIRYSASTSETMAYARRNAEGCAKESKRTSVHSSRCSETMANSHCQRSQGQREESIRTQEENNNISNPCWWESEPNVGRVANGVPNRVDRIKGLGNAIVPQVAYQIFKGLKNEKT